jgi:hypothetical protein
MGHAVAQLVGALHHKQEGRDFESRLCNQLNSLGRTLALGWTKPLTEVSRIFPGG